MGRDSVVGTAPICGLDGTGFETLAGIEVLSSPKNPSRSSLQPTQSL
jgi:hypothetical protein